MSLTSVFRPNLGLIHQVVGGRGHIRTKEKQGFQGSVAGSIHWGSLGSELSWLNPLHIRIGSGAFGLSLRAH